MLSEMLEILNPQDREIYVDGTFGAGGYTRAILDRADCTVIAIDRDWAAIARAEALKEKYGDRLIFLHGNFGDVADLLAAAGFGKVDGFVLDLGVSSMQFDEAERGFSFRFDGPLDMRMDTGQGATAADLVNTLPEKDLADLIYRYGDERQSRRIARKIVERRAEAPFKTTQDLAQVVRSCVPRSPFDDSDPATRTFQALRIAVNDELGALEHALAAADRILKSGGRMIVVSFHSLEDGRVKNFFRSAAGQGPQGSRYLPQQARPETHFTLLARKGLRPGKEEIARNPRARSAVLRAAARTQEVA